MKGGATRDSVEGRTVLRLGRSGEVLHPDVGEKYEHQQETGGSQKRGGERCKRSWWAGERSWGPGWKACWGLGGEWVWEPIKRGGKQRVGREAFQGGPSGGTMSRQGGVQGGGESGKQTAAGRRKRDKSFRGPWDEYLGLKGGQEQMKVTVVQPGVGGGVHRGPDGHLGKKKGKEKTGRVRHIDERGNSRQVNKDGPRRC